MPFLGHTGRKFDRWTARLRRGGGGIAWGSLVKLSSVSRRDGPVFDDEGADDVTVTCSHDRGHEAGRLGSHDPGNLPPGGQVSGEALQSVAGAAGRGRGPAISAGCS